jgi:hypothetical protein
LLLLYYSHIKLQRHFRIFFSCILSRDRTACFFLLFSSMSRHLHTNLLLTSLLLTSLSERIRKMCYFFEVAPYIRAKYVSGSIGNGLFVNDSKFKFLYFFAVARMAQLFFIQAPSCKLYLLFTLITVLFFKKFVLNFASPIEFRVRSH